MKNCLLGVNAVYRVGLGVAARERDVNRHVKQYPDVRRDPPRRKRLRCFNRRPRDSPSTPLVRERGIRESVADDDRSALKMRLDDIGYVLSPSGAEKQEFRDGRDSLAHRRQHERTHSLAEWSASRLACQDNLLVELIAKPPCNSSSYC